MKASVYIASSLDGYIAREDGDIDWLHSSDNNDASEDYGYEKFIGSVDALIMGRNSFEKVLSFDKWPYDDKCVVVLSSHSVAIPDELKTSVESSMLEPSALLVALESRGINHVYIDGGKTIQSFLRAGVISDFIITRIPILLGGGIPLFGSLDRDINLKHISTQSYSSGLVQSKYEVVQGVA